MRSKLFHLKRPREHEEYVPLTVTGDGSCFYRSISLLVNGDKIVAVRGKVPKVL